MALEWPLSLDHGIQKGNSQVVMKQVKLFEGVNQMCLSCKLWMCQTSGIRICQLTLYCDESDTLQNCKKLKPILEAPG